MTKKKSISIPKSFQILLLCLVIAWVLTELRLLPLPAYPVAIVLTLIIALIRN